MKQKIDYSKYICPNNAKHTLRASASPNYCDVWCDKCVSGWKFSELSQGTVAKTYDFLLSNNYSRSDYYAVHLSVTPEFKKKLLKLKETVMTMEYNMSLHSPEKTILSSSHAIEEDGLSFQNDDEDDYKEEVENNLPVMGVIESHKLKKPVNIRKFTCRTMDALGTCGVVVSHKGFKIIYDSMSDHHSRIETSVIPWNKID